jgi:hypothetical protein
LSSPVTCGTTAGLGSITAFNGLQQNPARPDVGDREMAQGNPNAPQGVFLPVQ